MFTIDLDAPSFYIYAGDESVEYILKELCTEECLLNFWDKDSDSYEIDLCESDILDYYLTKPSLTSWEQKLVTKYLDYMIDRSFNDVPCDLAIDFLKQNISNKFADEFLERLNPVTQKYFIRDILDAIKAGVSNEEDER